MGKLVTYGVLECARDFAALQRMLRGEPMTRAWSDTPASVHQLPMRREEGQGSVDLVALSKTAGARLRGHNGKRVAVNAYTIHHAVIAAAFDDAIGTVEEHGIAEVERKQ